MVENLKVRIIALGILLYCLINLSMKVLFVLGVTYNCAHLTIKISILLLYRKLFTFMNHKFKIAWYALLTYVVICWIFTTVLANVQCTPTSYSWEQVLGVPGHCLEPQGPDISSALAFLVADLGLFVMPLPILWALKVSLRRKIQLCFLFAFGSL